MVLLCVCILLNNLWFLNLGILEQLHVCGLMSCEVYFGYFVII